MSDTTTPEIDHIEAPITEAPTPETQETSPEENTSESKDAARGRKGGDRKPRRNDRKNSIREEQKEFQEQILSIDRVTRVTAGGRQLRFRVSIVIGDGKGRIGLGIGKSGEVQGAIEKAIRDAKKNLIKLEIVNDTIAHQVSANYKSSAIFLHPAHPGTGIIAGGSARKIFAVSGIKDIIAKQHGAVNPITNARVTLSALSRIKPTHHTKNFAKNPQNETLVSADTGANETQTKKTLSKKTTQKKDNE